MSREEDFYNKNYIEVQIRIQLLKLKQIKLNGRDN